MVRLFGKGNKQSKGGAVVAQQQVVTQTPELTDTVQTREPDERASSDSEREPSQENGATNESNNQSEGERETTNDSDSNGHNGETRRVQEAKSLNKASFTEIEFKTAPYAEIPQQTYSKRTRLQRIGFLFLLLVTSALLVAAVFANELLRMVSGSRQPPEFLYEAGFVPNDANAQVKLRPNRLVPGSLSDRTCLVSEVLLEDYGLPNQELLHCWGDASGPDPCLQKFQSSGTQSALYLVNTTGGVWDAVSGDQLFTLSRGRDLEAACWTSVVSGSSAQVEHRMGTILSSPAEQPSRYIGVAEKLYAAKGTFCVLMSSQFLGCYQFGQETDAAGFGFQVLDPTDGGLLEVVDVSLSPTYGCVSLVQRETSAGSVRCWGEGFEPNPALDFAGGLVEIPELAQVFPNTTGAVQGQIAAARRFVCSFGEGIRCVGNAPETGQNNGRELGYLPEQQSQVTTGENHFCVTTGRQTKCAGLDRLGVLGGSGLDSIVQLLGADGEPIEQFSRGYSIVSVSSHKAHNCVILENSRQSDPSRTVQCWGSNANGQLGFSPTVAAFSNSPIMLDHPKAVGLCDFLSSIPGAFQCAQLPPFQLDYYYHMGVIVGASFLTFFTLSWGYAKPVVRRLSLRLQSRRAKRKMRDLADRRDKLLKGRNGEAEDESDTKAKILAMSHSHASIVRNAKEEDTVIATEYK